MCRLYGLVATEETGLECSLVSAQNALLVQSDRDMRGVRNADGWGIAAWDEGAPGIVKGTNPAFADKEFVEIANSVFSPTVIAHIRAATIGRVSDINTHPFQYGPWVFAHNGTLHSFEHLRTHMDLGRFGPPVGTTDSETIFLWLLNRLEQHGLDAFGPSDRLKPIIDLIHDGIQELVQISMRAGATETPTLNLMLSDGKHLVASRWGNSLYWVYRNGITDCMVCGTSHCPNADEGYKAVVVASEPLTDEDWNEIPEGTIFGATPEIRTFSRSLVGPATLTA